LLIGYYLSPFKLSRHKFYMDEIYNAALVQPLRGLAWFSYLIDRWVVDGLVDLCGRLPVWLGGLMRSLQTGLVPFYALAMVLGTLTLLVARMLWGAE